MGDFDLRILLLESYDSNMHQNYLTFNFRHPEYVYMHLCNRYCMINNYSLLQDSC